MSDQSLEWLDLGDTLCDSERQSVVRPSCQGWAVQCLLYFHSWGGGGGGGRKVKENLVYMFLPNLMEIPIIPLVPNRAMKVLILNATCNESVMTLVFYICLLLGPNPAYDPISKRGFRVATPPCLPGDRPRENYHGLVLKVHVPRF